MHQEALATLSKLTRPLLDPIVLCGPGNSKKRLSLR